MNLYFSTKCNVWLCLEVLVNSFVTKLLSVDIDCGILGDRRQIIGTFVLVPDNLPVYT